MKIHRRSHPRLSMFLLVFVFCFSTKAQWRCGSDSLNEWNFRSNPVYRAAVLEARNRSVSKGDRKVTVDGLVDPSFVDTIPVVFHILHTGEPLGSPNNPTDETIRAYLEYTNQQFAATSPVSEGSVDVGFRFELARTDPYCGATNGINHIDASSIPYYRQYGVSAEGTSLGILFEDLKRFIVWDPNRYLNIWLVNKMDNGDISGVSENPYGDVFGPVIISSGVVLKGDLLAHEIGHCLNLRHVFAGGTTESCPANNDCLIDGDGICDTDPVTEPTGGCRTAINPCTQTAYKSNTENNIMNYSTCGNEIFTVDQRDLMQYTAKTAPVLISLGQSTTRFPPGDHGNCTNTIRLSGEKLNGGKVSLAWSGGMGSNPFVVEKSSDVFHYHALTQISVNGSGDYSLSDYSLMQSQNYYRVKQQTTEGQWIYSNTVNFEDSIILYDQVILRRNPVSQSIDVQLAALPEPSLKDEGIVSAAVRVMDMYGRVMVREVLQVYPGERFRVPVGNFAPGEYILEVTMNGKVFLKPVLKQ